MTDQKAFPIHSMQTALEETAARVVALQKTRPQVLVAIAGASPRRAST